MRSRAVGHQRLGHHLVDPLPVEIDHLEAPTFPFDVIRSLGEPPELKDRLALKELPEEDRGRYNTLAGMIMLLLGRLPETADYVEWEGWRFEVVDLDGKRVDKVMAQALVPDSTGAHI